MSIPHTLKLIRAELEAMRAVEFGELRTDLAVESEAIGDILHRLDAIDRCLQIVVTKVSHLHDDMAQRRTRRRPKKSTF
jgi:hypothetical protein